MNYKRNSKAVIGQLKETEAGQIVCKVDCRIQIPTRYIDKKIAQISVDTFIYGCFPIILDDTKEYAILNLPAMVSINPLKTTEVVVDEIDYYEFFFEANSVIIKNKEVVRNGSIIYSVLDEFIFNGKIPWYMNYEDVAKFLDYAKEFANSDIGQNIETIEFLASLITRPLGNRAVYIREIGKDYKDFDSSKIEYVPLKSVFYSVNSTLNKLAGSYFKDGVKSSLINKTEKAEKIESILRA